MRKIIIIVSALFLILYSVINYIIGKEVFIDIKNLLSTEQTLILKKYVFPYKYINQLVQENDQLEKRIDRLNIIFKSIKPYEIDIIRKKNLDQIIFKKNNQEISLGYKDLKLNIFQSDPLLLSGIYYLLPSSAYIDYYDNNLFLISSIGILGYGKINDDNIVLKQIKNNIEQFIGINQFEKNRRFSVKDLKIFNNKIYVSYTKEVTDDCWNTSVIFANLNYEGLNFENLFFSNECVHSKKNIDNEFNAIQSGGRIININRNNIILSIGDYKSRHLAQSKKSIFGKLIKININTGDFEIVSMGHRNPQGLYYDKKNNFILLTEHGPKGGDEINLVELNKEVIPNYGWAIASYGEHYGGKSSKKNKKKYEKYPLLKSHKENGFIEPLKYFVPSIAISEIVDLNVDKKYVFSSMKDKSIYFFLLNANRQIENIERIEIGERIRDLIFHQNKIILFLEDTASIGIINLDQK